MSTAAATNTRRERVLLFLVTACVVAYPPLYAVLRSGARGFFSYVRGDAFLYLTIARNSHAGFFSFDGTYPTNGFHPLWQYYLAALIPFGAEPGSMAPVHVALFSSLACVALGAGLAAVAIQRITRSWMLGCLVMPGVYYMLPGSIFVSQPIWEMVSGMECGASTLFGGALLYLISLHQDTPHDELLARRGLGSPFMQLGLLLPFVVMTRLDDVFLLPALALAVWWSFGLQPVRERIAAILRLGVPSALVVVAYVTFNRSYAGTFLPISGAVKNGFPLVLNTYLIASALFAPLVDLKNHFAPHPTDPVLLYNTGHRIVQLLAPTVFACVYGLWTVRKRPRGFVDVVSLGLAGYVVIKAGYNVAGVNLWHQGGWYFALTILVITFLSARVLQPLSVRIAGDPMLRWAAPFVYAGYVLLAATHYAEWSAFMWDPSEFQYLQDRASISAALKERAPGAKLIAFDDGITGYSLPIPTLHGFVFAADLDAFKALRAGKLLAHAYARGHRVLTSACYMPVTEPLATPEAARAFLQQSFLEPDVKRELDDFDFRLIYVDPPTHAPFFEMTPRAH